MSEPVTSEEFDIGEVVICLVGVICRGMEGTLMGEITDLRRDGRYGKGFLIEIPGQRSSRPDGFFMVFADEIRKKRPPREDLQVVRWSECPWQPQQVNA